MGSEVDTDQMAYIDEQIYQATRRLQDARIFQEQAKEFGSDEDRFDAQMAVNRAINNLHKWKEKKSALVGRVGR